MLNKSKDNVAYSLIKKRISSYLSQACDRDGGRTDQMRRKASEKKFNAVCVFFLFVYLFISMKIVSFRCLLLFKDFSFTSINKCLNIDRLNVRRF